MTPLQQKFAAAAALLVLGAAITLQSYPDRASGCRREAFEGAYKIHVPARRRRLSPPSGVGPAEHGRREGLRRLGRASRGGSEATVRRRDTADARRADADGASGSEVSDDEDAPPAEGPPEPPPRPPRGPLAMARPPGRPPTRFLPIGLPGKAA